MRYGSNDFHINENGVLKNKLGAKTNVASQKNCEKKPLKLRKLNSKIFSLF